MMSSRVQMGRLSTNWTSRRKRVRIGRDRLKRIRGKLTPFLLRAQRDKGNTWTFSFTEPRPEGEGYRERRILHRVIYAQVHKWSEAESKSVEIKMVNGSTCSTSGFNNILNFASQTDNVRCMYLSFIRKHDLFPNLGCTIAIVHRYYRNKLFQRDT